MVVDNIGLIEKLTKQGSPPFHSQLGSIRGWAEKASPGSKIPSKLSIPMVSKVFASR
jgi:hypothetical protein